MQRERQLARLSQEPQAFVSHARKGRGFHALVGFSLSKIEGSKLAAWTIDASSISQARTVWSAIPPA